MGTRAADIYLYKWNYVIDKYKLIELVNNVQSLTGIRVNSLAYDYYTGTLHLEYKNTDMQSEAMQSLTDKIINSTEVTNSTEEKIVIIAENMRQLDAETYIYAEVFKDICNTLGIKCKVVEGKVANTTEHSWNEVVIGGDTMVIDIYNYCNGRTNGLLILPDSLYSFIYSNNYNQDDIQSTYYGPGETYTSPEMLQVEIEKALLSGVSTIIRTDIQTDERFISESIENAIEHTKITPKSTLYALGSLTISI